MQNGSSTPDWFLRGKQADSAIQESGEVVATLNRLENDGLGKSRTIRRDRSLYLAANAWLHANSDLRPIEEWKISAEAMTTLVSLRKQLADREFWEIAERAVSGRLQRAALRKRWSEFRQDAHMGEIEIPLGRPRREATRKNRGLPFDSVLESIVAVELPRIFSGRDLCRVIRVRYRCSFTPDLLIVRSHRGEVGVEAVEVKSYSAATFQMPFDPLIFERCTIPFTRCWYAIAVKMESPPPLHLLEEIDRKHGVIWFDLNRRTSQIAREAVFNPENKVPDPWASVLMGFLVS